jgi:hypothetical protein
MNPNTVDMFPHTAKTLKTVDIFPQTTDNLGYVSNYEREDVPS